MKKKLLLLTVLVMTFICLFAISASAERVLVGGIYYETDTTALTAKVSTYNMANCTLETVDIPETITPVEGGPTYVVNEIPEAAFGANTSSANTNKYVKTIIIPKTVSKISTHAFRSITQLEEVTIKAQGYNPATGETSTLSFSNAEFWGCTSLKKVDMSESTVKAIGQHCFSGCSALTTVLFSPVIDSISGQNVFLSCKNLTTINVEALESLTVLSVAFKGLTNITGDFKFPNLKTLSSNAFQGTSITSVDFTGAPITEFGEAVFDGCTSLTRIVFPDNLQKLGVYALRSCSNAEFVNFNPENLTSVSGGAFNGCAKLTQDLISPNLTYVGDNAFQGTKITRVYVPKLQSTGKDIFNALPLKEAVIPDNVDNIADTIFSSCGSLRLVICVGGDGTAAKDKIGTLGSFTIKPFSEYVSNVDYASGSEKVIFEGVSPMDLEKGDFVYFDGYDKPFSTWNYTTDEKADYSAILTHSGYSISPDGTGIASGFSINQSSLLAYEKLFGKIKYGIVIFNPNYLGDEGVFVDGKINSTTGAIQVSIDTTYVNTSVYVKGFDISQTKYQNLELVFAGYAYVDGKMDTTLEFIQREYVGTEEKPVDSPMASKVTRGDYVLYTVKFANVQAFVPVTTDKNGLGEYAKTTASN